MADQKILTSGVTAILTYMGTTFKYMAFGNGSWTTSELISSSRTTLKNEKYRVQIMSYQIVSNTITFYGVFTGANLGSPYTLTEVGLTNLAAYNASQQMMAMKVFSKITLLPTDSKVIRIICSLQYDS